MLRKASKLIGFSIAATDGEIGKIEDIYFDDRTWHVRYLVVNTAFWLQRNVLIPPVALESVDDVRKRIHVTLTRQQVKESPPWDSSSPVSRTYEKEYHEYYGFSPYWKSTSGVESNFSRQSAQDEYLFGDFQDQTEPMEGNPADECHLRSAKEILGYHIQALDGEIGHVEDFIVEDEEWILRYVEVDTRNWWVGKKVLVSPMWISDISWQNRKLFADLERDRIKEAPEYKHHEPITREYEKSLFNYWGWKGYWVREEKVEI